MSVCRFADLCTSLTAATRCLGLRNTFASCSTSTKHRLTGSQSSNGLFRRCVEASFNPVLADRRLKILLPLQIPKTQARRRQSVLCQLMRRSERKKLQSDAWRSTSRLIEMTLDPLLDQHLGLPSQRRLRRDLPRLRRSNLSRRRLRRRRPLQCRISPTH